MPSRRLRVWDATIVAAAITAGLGGLFSMTAVFSKATEAKLVSSLKVS